MDRGSRHGVQFRSGLEQDIGNGIGLLPGRVESLAVAWQVHRAGRDTAPHQSEKPPRIDFLEGCPAVEPDEQGGVFVPTFGLDEHDWDIAHPVQASPASQRGRQGIEVIRHVEALTEGGSGRDPAHMLQIIGGHYRSRRLHTPADAETTRPYAHRVKESVFNILRGHLEGARVLDLFAGVGTMGIEAISRGATEVLMVEQDRRIFSLLQQNVEELGCTAEADLLRGDALASVALLRSPRPLDIVFVDPPFALMRTEAGRQRVLDQIGRAAGLLDPEALVVLRTPLDANRTPHEVPQMAGPEVRDHGRHHQVLLYAPQGEA